MDELVKVEIPNINICIPLNMSNFIDIKNSYQVNTTCKPRQKDPIYVPPKKKKKRIKWSFPISLMAKWRQDDQELINLCFEYDYECSKI